jgi:hypothetical protein
MIGKEPLIVSDDKKRLDSASGFIDSGIVLSVDSG